jgi:uncharacterized protein YbjT (DUF2867 family)
VKTALIAGATGLVGRQCLDLMLESGTFSRITALVRRPPADKSSGGQLEMVVGDFERLESNPGLFAVDLVVCALGTTMRTAGSQQAFRRVDHDYPLQIARLARTRGAGHFLLVSSIGADARSRVFYSRVKGELEDAVTALGYPSLTIIRPSFLLGERAEFRIGEELMKRVGFLLPLRYRPIHARRVAGALVQAAIEGRPGRQVIENVAIHLRPATP